MALALNAESEVTSLMIVAVAATTTGTTLPTETTTVVDEDMDSTKTKNALKEHAITVARKVTKKQIAGRKNRTHIFDHKDTDLAVVMVEMETTVVEIVAMATAQQMVENETANAGFEFQMPAIDLGIETAFSAPMSLLSDPDYMIADSGASTHQRGSQAGMINIRTVDQLTSYGDGQSSRIMHRGDVPVTIKTNKGMANVTLTNASVKQGGYNLFSTTRAQEDGWETRGNKTGIHLTKDGVTISFDIPMRTPTGVVWLMHCPVRREVGAAETPSNQPPKKPKPYNVAHAQLGHTGEDATRQTAKHLGWDITRGSTCRCIACAAMKIKRKTLLGKNEGVVRPKIQIAKEDVEAAIGTRFYIDQASVRKSPEGFAMSKPNMRMLVEGRTQYKMVAFLESKDDQVQITCKDLHSFKERGMPVRYVRCDNAGENKSLEKALHGSEWKMTGTEMEYTARNTPQQNSVAEVSIYVTVIRAKTMMFAANVPKKYRYKLFPYAVGTAVKTDNLMIVMIGEKKATRAEHFTGKLPSIVDHLRTWGEAGSVKTFTHMLHICCISNHMLHILCCIYNHMLHICCIHS
jgi:hypothetical protein